MTLMIVVRSVFACACIVLCLLGIKGACFTLENFRVVKGVKPLSLSQKREVCRAERMYSNTEEAKCSLGKNLSICAKNAYDDALTHFCVNQCSTLKNCMPNCAEVCAPWERAQRALYAHNGSKAEKILKGVWQCMVTKDTHQWYQYSTLRDTAMKRHKDAFLSAEKDCEEAGSDFLTSLTKVCAVLHDMQSLEKTLSEETALPMHTIMLDAINHYIHKAQNEEIAVWLASHKTLTPQNLQTTCRILHNVVLQALSALKAFEDDGVSHTKECENDVA